MEQPWDLFRRGQLDQERHHRLIREAIRKNLADLVTHGTLTAGGRVRIPVRALRQWRFEFDPEKKEQTGTFDQSPDGSSGRPRKGDVLGQKPRPGKGDKKGHGGDGGDEGFYDVEVGLEAVADTLFADLELPRLQRKEPAEQFTEDWKMEDLRRKGALSNLDKRRTVMENIRRNAAIGAPGYGNLADADLRFRTPEIRRLPQDQVAVLFIRDCSASMGEQEKHLTRMLAFWITRFLQYKYQKAAQKAFVLFHTAAAEVSEDEFFHRSEGGGTAVSSGFELAEQIIQERFDPSRYNLYAFAFSDGDNPDSDTDRAVNVVRQLSNICNLVGYADIRPGHHTQWSDVAHSIRALGAPHVVTVNLRSQDDVLKAMQRFFRKHDTAAG